MATATGTANPSGTGKVGDENVNAPPEPDQFDPTQPPEGKERSMSKWKWLLLAAFVVAVLIGIAHFTPYLSSNYSSLTWRGGWQQTSPSTKTKDVKLKSSLGVSGKIVSKFNKDYQIDVTTLIQLLPVIKPGNEKVGTIWIREGNLGGEFNIASDWDTDQLTQILSVLESSCASSKGPSQPTTDQNQSGPVIESKAGDNKPDKNVVTDNRYRHYHTRDKKVYYCDQHPCNLPRVDWQPGQSTTVQ